MIEFFTGAFGLGWETFAVVLVVVFLVDSAFGFEMDVVVLVSVVEVEGVLVISPTQTVTEDSEVLEPYCKPEELDAELEQALANWAEETESPIAKEREKAKAGRFFRVDMAESYALENSLAELMHKS